MLSSPLVCEKRLKKTYLWNIQTVDEPVGVEVEGQDLGRADLLRLLKGVDEAGVQDPQSVALVHHNSEDGGQAIAVSLPVELQVGIGVEQG